MTVTRDARDSLKIHVAIGKNPIKKKSSRESTNSKHGKRIEKIEDFIRVTRETGKILPKFVFQMESNLRLTI